MSTPTPSTARITPLPPPSRLTLFGILLRWALYGVGPALPLIVAVQTIMSVSIIIGFGLIIPNIDQQTAMFLSSGAPTVILALTGFVIVPQAIAEAKADGMIDFQRALPIPRFMMMLSEFIMWVLITLPGLALGIIIGQLYYGFSYTIDWPVFIVASFLVALTTTVIGYAIALTLPRTVAMVITQLLVFFVMLFSPVNYPADVLPQWLQALHHWLPIQSAGDLIRSGLIADRFPMHTRDFVVLIIWALASLGIAMRVIVRRD